MPQVLKGHCLCGQSTITIQNASSYDKQVLCHCFDCKRTSGSAFSSNILANQADTKIEGPIKHFDGKGASGNTVTRVFCGNCGCALAHKSVAFGDAMAVQTGPFEDLANALIVAELFSKSRNSTVPAIEGAGQK